MHRLKLLAVGLILFVGALLFPTFTTGLTGIKLIKVGKDTLRSTQDYAQNFFSTGGKERALQLKSNLDQLSKTLLKFNQQTSKNWLTHKVIVPRQAQLDLASDLVAIAQKILTGQQSYVLLFQNTEELRATGGFLGSYAKVELDEGVLKKFKIEDIYVPDGQFSWFIEAPSGAKEYLSGGDGLRLRDANWSPDFPTSARQVMTYLAWGKENNIDGAIAVNLPLVEEVLAITGPVYLPDYDQTVTKSNFADVARADRDLFFPGSVQKQHFLKTFFNQLLIKLQNLDQSQQLALLKLMASSARKKNLQFFSNDQTLQSIFEKLKISGQLTQVENAAYLMLVESNVGINKANRLLDRAVDIQIFSQEAIINITFTNRNLPPLKQNSNSNEAKHLGYVDYQRIILSPEVKIREIWFDGKKITEWDEQLITNSYGQEFKQVGFLISLEERQTKTLVIKTYGLLSREQSQLFIQKQAGLSQVPYHLTRNKKEFSFELDEDILLNLDN